LLQYVKGSENCIRDVGCANGANGRYLLDKEIANGVYGFEYNKAMAIEAKMSLNDVFVGDIETIDLEGQFI